MRRLTFWYVPTHVPAVPDTSVFSALFPWRRKCRLKSYLHVFCTSKAAQCLKRFTARLSPRRPRSSNGYWTKWRWERFLSEQLCNPLSVSFHEFCVLILLVLLSELENWILKFNQHHIGNRGPLDREVSAHVKFALQTIVIWIPYKVLVYRRICHWAGTKITLCRATVKFLCSLW